MLQSSSQNKSEFGKWVSAPTTLLFPGRAKNLSKNDDPKSARKFFGRSVLSVRRVGLQVGCVLTRFARARA